MRALLLLVSLFVATSVAVNSTYSATPNKPILPVFANTKLTLDSSYLILDLDAGLFYLNVSTLYENLPVSKELPVATATGYVSFQQGGIIMFTPTACIQARSAPSLCDDPNPFLFQLINGPFYFGTVPSTGNVDELTIQSTTSNPNPNPLGPINFLGATQPIAYTCSGTCASLNDQVPQPSTLNVTVRFLCRSLKPRKLINYLECHY